jgi:hypothetical protein
MFADDSDLTTTWFLCRSICASRRPASQRSSPGASAAPAADARIDHLQELADLHDRGVLTDAEFAEEKARILKGP